MIIIIIIIAKIIIFPFYQKKIIWLVDFYTPADFADLRRKKSASICGFCGRISLFLQRHRRVRPRGAKGLPQHGKEGH